MASNGVKIREWSIRFERFQRSAKSVSRFCKDEQVSVQAFYYWRERVQANSRNAQVSATGKTHVTGKAAVTGGQVVDSEVDCVRMIIHVGAISIECHAETSSALEAVLSWAARNQEGSFKQLIGR